MRKLGSIQKIKAIAPIEGADAIEKIEVLGWELVAKKGEFKVGDFCVYVEIDSILPDKSEFEFMRPRKFRVKTIKLRGQISQGIAFPVSILPSNVKIEEDLDVTEILGIIKWDPEQESIIIEKEPVFDDKNKLVRFYKKHKYLITRRIKKALGISIKTTKDDFPSYVPKTDETRVQTMLRGLTTHEGKVAYITEKLEGCLDGSVLIETKDGFKTIKEIVETKYSGKVKSYNVERGKLEWCKVIGHSVKENINNWYEIETNSNINLPITGNHGIWIPELNCYRRVDELEGKESFLIKE